MSLLIPANLLTKWQPSKATEPAPAPRQKLSKQQQNIAILEASDKVALKSKNNTLSLLYKTALSGIKQELGPTLIAQNAPKNINTNLAPSPTDTANRIVSFATSMFAAYQQQPNADYQQQLDSFLGVIGKGLQQGAANTQAVLNGLNAYNEDAQQGVSNTFDLVLNGLQRFKTTMLAEQQQASQTAEKMTNNTTR